MLDGLRGFGLCSIQMFFSSLSLPLEKMTPGKDARRSGLVLSNCRGHRWQQCPKVRFVLNPVWPFLSVTAATDKKQTLWSQGVKCCVFVGRLPIVDRGKFY
jgi:hypothetical protein